MVEARKAVEADIRKIDPELIASQAISEARAAIAQYTEAAKLHADQQGEQVMRDIWVALKPTYELTSRFTCAMMGYQG